MRQAFGLNDLETEFVLFFFICKICDPCLAFFIGTLDVEQVKGRKYLEKILGMNVGRANRFRPDILRRAGILLQRHDYFAITDEIVDFLQLPSSAPPFIKFFRPLDKGKALPLDCHLMEKKHTDHVLKLLNEKPGISTHILLYGPPGTGKTSYAHGIANQLGIPAYEITRNENNSTQFRRAAIVACLNIANHSDGSLIIVDEADNLLNTVGSWFSRGETQDKGWLNELMEESGGRFIWITNDIDAIADSVMRRFAFSIHFRPFDRQQRVQIWNTVLGQNKIKKAFGEEEIGTLAGKYQVSAGAIDMAVRKALEVQRPKDKCFRDTVTMALDAYVTLLMGGQKPMHKDQIETNYSIEGLNIEGNLQAMMVQLEAFDRYLRKSPDENVKNMNLLFFGPPGTGKSELARYIATGMHREILCKRASDIFDPYVGISERNIREIFRTAEQEGAVLIIDEADTLLFDRQRALHSWEISFTNEFLTQMERYRGILICTTNRLEDLDNAAIRRFNHKIGFHYLKPDDNIIFYRRLLGSLTETSLSQNDECSIRSIENLAPGDYRVVRDRFSFYPKEEIAHCTLIQSLCEEVNIRNKQQRQSRQIGF